MSATGLISAIQAARQGFVRAYLEIVEPEVEPDDKIIPLAFNPTEYQISKQNSFTEIPIPGLESPPIQFIRGASQKLSTELIVDTSDTMDDVRERYTDKLRALMNVDFKLHAPPIVEFVWGPERFRGVVDSLNITYLLFTPEGTPVRAKLALSLKEYRPVEIQIKEMNRASPDVDKAYTVRRGDTLSSIAGAVYRDPTRWREIARANAIRDPRRLEPGVVLSIPKLQ